MNAHASLTRRSTQGGALALAVLVGLAATTQPARAQKAPRDVLAMLPEDTVLVASLDLARARSSKLFAKASAAVSGRLAQDDLLVGAGLDPVRDLDRVVLGVAGSVDKPRLQVLIGEGRITLDPAKHADKAKVHRGVTYLALPELDVLLQGKKIYATGSGQMPELIDLMARKRPNATRSRKAAEVRAAMASIDRRSEAWLAMRADKGTTIPGGGGTVMWVAVAVSGTTTLAIEVHGKLDSEASAASLVSKSATELTGARSQLKALGLPTVSDSLSIQASGAVLSGAVTIPEAEQDVLMRLAGAFL